MLLLSKGLLDLFKVTLAEMHVDQLAQSKVLLLELLDQVEVLTRLVLVLLPGEAQDPIERLYLVLQLKVFCGELGLVGLELFNPGHLCFGDLPIQAFLVVELNQSLVLL